MLVSAASAASRFPGARAPAPRAPRPGSSRALPRRGPAGNRLRGARLAFREVSKTRGAPVELPQASRSPRRRAVPEPLVRRERPGAGSRWPLARLAMPFDVKRVQKELADVSEDRAAGVTLAPAEDGSDLSHLVGSFCGPPDSPYAGGWFYVDIRLGDGYPFVPPDMRFSTKVWHPNVSSANGAICLDVLSKAWSPALTLKTALLSVQALLAAPQPDDPQDAVVARQLLDDPELFRRTARYWTDSFAVKRADGDQGVAQLVDMGFSEEDAKAALQATGGDVAQAMERLLGGV